MLLLLYEKTPRIRYFLLNTNNNIISQRNGHRYDGEDQKQGEYLL